MLIHGGQDCHARLAYSAAPRRAATGPRLGLPAGSGPVRRGSGGIAAGSGGQRGGGAGGNGGGRRRKPQTCLRDRPIEHRNADFFAPASVMWTSLSQIDDGHGNRASCEASNAVNRRHSARTRVPEALLARHCPSPARTDAIRSASGRAPRRSAIAAASSSAAPAASAWPHSSR